MDTRRAGCAMNKSILSIHATWLRVDIPAAKASGRHQHATLTFGRISRQCIAMTSVQVRMALLFVGVLLIILSGDANISAVLSQLDCFSLSCLGTAMDPFIDRRMTRVMANSPVSSEDRIRSPRESHQPLLHSELARARPKRIEGGIDTRWPKTSTQRNTR